MGKGIESSQSECLSLSHLAAPQILLWQAHNPILLVIFCIVIVLLIIIYSVEHLSKWYDMMNIFVNNIPFQFVISSLEDYVKRGKDYPVTPFLKQTIAVIAFKPFTAELDVHSDLANQLTIPTLAATIESIRRAGMGRVVVVGVNADKDRSMVEEVFQRVYRQLNRNQPSEGPVTHLGHLEVAFCDGLVEDAQTSDANIKLNVPKATLMGLRRAVSAAQEGRSQEENVKAWLGDHETNHWQYIYLTAPDSVLNTRPSTLKTLQEQLNNGMVLLPWRFQLMPHEADVEQCAARDLFVHRLPHGEFFYDVHELDALELHPDKCCDEAKGPDFKPWKEVGEDCGKSWYVLQHFVFHWK